MRELIPVLQKASRAYYAQDTEIMSNFEYDRLYDELQALEAETGIVLSGSPSVTVGYEAVDALPKERHEKPMLSLAKTKEREELKSWLGDKEGLLSWKLDGLTIVLTYEGGQLVKAVTRGNGEVGEVITPNARVFRNIPGRIPYQGSLVLRGEAVIPYSEFEKINAQIEDADAKYKNPRNLCSGSVRQLNNEITAKRSVYFYAFSYVKAELDGAEPPFENDRENQFRFLKEQGFDVVPYKRVNADTIMAEIEWYAQAIQTYDIPSDGLVLCYCDLAYSASLGLTAKFPRDSIAFKWADETAETTLLEIEWSPSRTGLINPVAIFEPVELEGTTVSRASVHNISVMKALSLGIGDKITVYKANMIIPQIAENLTKSGVKDIPAHCPACGADTKIEAANEAEVLYCTNPDCPAKKIKSFALFVSRDALNVDGLSEATLEKFIGKGFIHSFADIFHLEQHADTIKEMEGFGEKSCANLMAAIEKSRKVDPIHLIFALCIPNIGADAGKKLIAALGTKGFLSRIESGEGFEDVDGIGVERSNALLNWFADDENKNLFDRLMAELTLEDVAPKQEADGTCKGLSFVITGDVHLFKNRSAFKAYVEQQGGAVTGSVSGKTTYLVSNDGESNSSKTKKAKELGVPILSEEEFVSRFGGPESADSAEVQIGIDTLL